MNKKIIAVILAGTMTFSLCSCGSSQEKAEETSIQTQTETQSEAVHESEVAEETQAVAETETEATVETESEVTEAGQTETFDFAQLEGMEFSFSSGAGAWGTTLRISGNGSFKGTYRDSDLGSIGEGYPNGTVYLSEFSGFFSQPVKINDYTYAMEIQEIEFENEVGTEEIKDEILFSYTVAQGLEDAERILLYLPGTPISELSEDFLYWVSNSALSEIGDDGLPFYALNNEVNQQGFVGYERSNGLDILIDNTEEAAAEIEEKLQNEDLTQLDYNELTGDLYECWDDMLNETWEFLKGVKSEEDMETLTTEQLEWIAEKEQAVEEAGAEYEGGSMQPMIKNQKAAEMTRERVYELLEYLS